MTSPDCDDPLYETAMLIAKARKRLSFPTLQRELRIGYFRARSLLDEMEKRGMVELIPTERGGHWQILPQTSRENV